jgi:hypothetical protein
MFFGLVPNEILTLKGDPCNVEKNSKEMIMILLTRNVCGTDGLPPLLTGRVKTLGALKTSECFPQNMQPTEIMGYEGQVTE